VLQYFSTLANYARTWSPVNPRTSSKLWPSVLTISWRELNVHCLLKTEIG